MADWKVSPEIIEVKTHPNADKLDVLKVGEYQLVAGKGNYNDGDVVIIIPEKSVIPPGPIYEEFKDYLTGKDKNRVKAIRLRGELSEAITWPLHRLDDLLDSHQIESLLDLSIGEDISGLLGITKYEPPIPQQLQGQVKPIEGFPYTRKHDAHHYASYADEFTRDDYVIVTEKIHGSQLNYFWSEDREVVSSKGLLKKGFEIEESQGNAYWQAVRNCDLKIIASALGGERVQIIGELIPVQKGFDYGRTGNEVRIFEVVVDGKTIPWDEMDSEDLAGLWVPIIAEGYLGDFEVDALNKYARGKEQVSGEERHIREGVVVRPLYDRKAHDGKRLHLKVINPKYKDDDEAVN